MDRDFQRRVMDGFDEALTIDPDERESWIDRAYSGDAALRDAISHLVAASDRRALMPTELPDAALLSDGPPVPERIGSYRPVALIGAGGMGQVYRAQRADGHFEQTVAIKVIAARLFSATAAEQFRVERQILARLHHPHIATLFDGGITDDGLSYIVMELVNGQPITDHADALELDIKARLGLFRDVCAAVQYAHQQLVVHADIKPNNILVDGSGCVKLLDFGVGASLADHTDAGVTAPGARTPGWASPQLAAGQRPTPPDDIFALGLLLRALIPSRERANADLRAIGDRAAAAEPDDRYPSADALAADVEHWLTRHPVTARRAGRTHRAALFWRRNRLAVVVTAAATVGLMVALISTSALYWRAENARRETQERFEEVRALSRFMLGDVTDALDQSPGTSRLRRALALRGRSYLERLSRIPGAPIDLRIETAEGYSKAGAILARNSDANAGDPVAGRAALQRADKELTALVRLLPGRDDVRLDLARTLIAEATVAASSFNNNAGALGDLDRSDAILNGVARRSPGFVEAGWIRWSGRNARADILNEGGKFQDMVPLLETALREGRSLPIPRHRFFDRPIFEGGSLRLLGDAQFYLNHPEQALRTYEQAVAIVDHARRVHATAKLFDRSAFLHYEVAATLSSLGRSAEALPWIDRGAAIIAALSTFDDSPRTQHVENIVTLQRAETLGELHHYDQAIAQMLVNVEARRRLAAVQPDNYEERRALPVALRPLIDLYFTVGRIDAGCRTLAEAKMLWARLARSGGLAGYDQSDEMADLANLERRCPAGAAGAREPDSRS